MAIGDDLLDQDWGTGDWGSGWFDPSLIMEPIDWESWEADAAPGPGWQAGDTTPGGQTMGQDGRWYRQDKGGNWYPAEDPGPVSDAVSRMTNAQSGSATTSLGGGWQNPSWLSSLLSSMGSGINSLLGNPSFGNLLSSAIPALASGALGQNAFDEAFAKLRKTFNPGAAEQEMLDYVTGRSRGREMTGVESTINDMLAGGKIPGMEDLDKFAASSQKFADTPLDYKSILGQIDPIVQPYLQKAVESENYGRRKIGSALTASGSFYGTPQVDLEGRLARETNTAMSQAIAQLAQGERSLRSGEALAGNRGLSAVPGMRQSLLSGAQQLDPQKRILDERLDTSYKGAQLAGQSRGNIASATSTGIGQAAKMAETAAGTPYNVLALQQLLRGG